MLTVITPTTGKSSLERLIGSIEESDHLHIIHHLLLWDNKRDGTRTPESYNNTRRLSLVLPDGTGRNGRAPGSVLRAVGLILAKTPWVTFADDDVWWEPNHLNHFLAAAPRCNWMSSARRIWTATGECLGVDRFESVGDDASRKTPYEMCDGNTMIFKRELGVLAAPLYRETTSYNDDRLMYAFLKQRAGTMHRTRDVTINHVCPEQLESFFRRNCSTD